MKITTLTKAEEQIMQHLWKLNKGFLKDLLEEFPDPKPHSNTIATILKILVDKGFVGFKVHGRQHEYFPLVSKETYGKKSLTRLMKNYFEGSYKNVVSFLVDKDEMRIEDLEILLKELKDEK